MDSSKLLKSFPHEGELFEPEYTKFKEMIVFVHWYGGHKKQLRRHVQFVNQLGFRAFVFNLFPQPFEGSWKLLKNPSVYSKTLISRWSRQVLDVLQCFQEEKKILFGFSFGSNVITQIFSKSSHVTAVIFDGGPFAGVFENPWRYLSYQEPIQNPLLRSLMLIPWNLFCGFFTLTFKIHSALKTWPSGLPVLSFRAFEDKLAPPSSIDNILKPYSQLDMEVVFIPEVQHLQGIKFQSEFYKEKLEKFLTKYAAPLSQ